MLIQNLTPKKNNEKKLINKSNKILCDLYMCDIHIAVRSHNSKSQVQKKNHSNHLSKIMKIDKEIHRDTI